MSDFQAIADRVEIEALRGEFVERADEINIWTPVRWRARRRSRQPRAATLDDRRSRQCRTAARSAPHHLLPHPARRTRLGVALRVESR